MTKFLLSLDVRCSVDRLALLTHRSLLSVLVQGALHDDLDVAALAAHHFRTHGAKETTRGRILVEFIIPAQHVDFAQSVAAEYLLSRMMLLQVFVSARTIAVMLMRRPSELILSHEQRVKARGRLYL